MLVKLKSKNNFVWIKRKLTPEQAKLIKKLDLEGIGFVEEFRRYYPNGNFAGQILGYTGIDSQGLEGIENKYDTAFWESIDFILQIPKLPKRLEYLQSHPDFSIKAPR